MYVPAVEEFSIDWLDWFPMSLNQNLTSSAPANIYHMSVKSSKMGVE